MNGILNESPETQSSPEFTNPLALDLGGTTGFAYLRKGKMYYGSIALTTIGEGARSYMPACHLSRWLSNMFELFKFDAIAFEETFARGAAKLRLDSMQTICALHCIERGLPWARISASGLKKYATGSGKCGKDQMIEAAKQFFPEIADQEITHDEADAICVLAWVKGMEK
jgi:Holliday junction resolvasome RuvABC endonuclease subunit